MRKGMGLFLAAASISVASMSSLAGKTAQPPSDNVIAQADRSVTIAGMGTTTKKTYAIDLRRCASLSGAEKASCVSFARQRHGDI